MDFEQQTLERVMMAREHVSDAREQQNITELGKAEGELRGAIGRLFAVAGGSGGPALEIRDFDSQQLVMSIGAWASNSWFRALDFAPDSRRLAVAFGNPPFTVKILDLISRSELTSFESASLPYNLRFHPDQTNLLLVSDETTVVRLWDWPNHTVIRRFEHPGWVKGIAWHRDGKFFAAACQDFQIYLWDIDTGQRRNVLDCE